MSEKSHYARHAIICIYLRTNCILTTCVNISILNDWVHLYLRTVCVHYIDMVVYCMYVSLLQSLSSICSFTRDNHYVERFEKCGWPSMQYALLSTFNVNGVNEIGSFVSPYPNFRRPKSARFR